MKILFATDGSNSAGQARDFLVSFPFPPGSQAVVLGVIEGPPLDMEEETGVEHSRAIRETQDALREETEQYLADEGERLVSAGWAVSTEIRYGNPAEEIIRVAGERGVDVVVLGSHGTSGIRRFLLGSVSDRVLIYAGCSVLIIRPPGAGIDAEEVRARWRILLAYDNSAPSRKALDLCASLPLDDHAAVTAVSVMPMVTAYRQDIRQRLNSIWQQKKQAARAALDDAVQSLRRSIPEVSGELREGGDVSEEILDMAEKTGSDLILVGCKGKSAIQRFLLGSITNRIARHAPCSVWAVRD